MEFLQVVNNFQIVLIALAVADAGIQNDLVISDALVACKLQGRLYIPEHIHDQVLIPGLLPVVRQTAGEA